MVLMRNKPVGSENSSLDFPVTFPRVACYLCCQVALGETEGSAQGVPTVQVKKWPTSNLINVIKVFFSPIRLFFVGYLL